MTHMEISLRIIDKCGVRGDATLCVGIFIVCSYIYNGFIFPSLNHANIFD